MLLYKIEQTIKPPSGLYCLWWKKSGCIPTSLLDSANLDRVEISSLIPPLHKKYITNIYKGNMCESTVYSRKRLRAILVQLVKENSHNLNSIGTMEKIVIEKEK